MPINCSWANFEDRDGHVYPKAYQVLATIPFAFGMLVIRFFVERCIAVPLADAMGIKSMRRIKPQPNPTLEAFFKECTKKPSHTEIRGLAKKCNWTVHFVEKWFRRRRNIEIPTLHKRFQEACWRMIFYTSSFVAGIIFLYDPLLPSQYWYYMAQMSFYLSLLFTLGVDTKRKDFKAHVVHHLAALCLMFTSWSANYVRLGTLVIIVHDAADYWLEAAKLFNYAKWEKACNVFFVIFSIAFFITRLVLFPFWILRATLYYPTLYTDTLVAAYFVFNVQLLVLQGLHLYWGYFVFNILKKFIFVKNVKDDRSDEEEDDSFSDIEDKCVKNGSKNGCGSSKPLLKSSY
ncbi:ceramide synthase 3 isoform X2 [Elgaria multicarinata webbii]|uniref:ceramide synthase 3 isoform X2 n=1 Tax=Elgaria multicarinata webbii TaxID=159646 RepID=UPI002FCCE324